MLGDLAPKRPVKKTYGRQSRRASTNTSSPFAARVAESSSDDSDADEVATALLRRSAESSRGKAGEGQLFAAGRNLSTPETSRVIGGAAGVSAGGSSTARRSVPTMRGYVSSIASASRGGGADVEWDEDTAMATLGAPRAARSFNASGMMRPVKSFASSTAESPIVRAGISPSRPSQADRKGKGREVPPVQDALEIDEEATPKAKRARTTPNPLTIVPPPLHDPLASPRRHPTTPSQPRPGSPTSIASSVPVPPRTPIRASNPNSALNSPARPRSPVKDLSDIFEKYSSSVVVSSTVGQRAASGMVAKMGAREKVQSPNVRDFSPPLSRANTFPGEGSPTSNPASPSRPLGSTTSLPLVLPPKSNRPISPSKPLSRHGSTLLNFSEPPPRQAPVAGSKRTYGGARSFRRDTEEESLFSIPSIPSDAASTTSSRKLPSLPPMRQRERISYATARAAQDSDELLEASLGGVTELKTVTQLRAKGENARFADEFDYLVEGLEPGCELSSRRSSAIEVLRKVGDGEFMRRLKASGFVERTYLEFRRADAGNGDRVLDPALAVLVATLVRDQRIAEPLLRVVSSSFSTSVSDEESVFEEQTCDVLAMLGIMMGREWAGDEIGGKESGRGMSKSDVRSIESVRKTINQSALFDDGLLPVTIRSLALVAISIVASYPPRTIFRPQVLICSSGALEAVVHTLIKETKGIEQRMVLYEAGLDLLPTDGSINLSLLDLCLNIFESTSSSAPSHTHYILTQHLSPLCLSLSHLLLASHILAGGPDLSEASKGMDCLLSTLRLLAELTTKDPDWSLELSKTPRMVSTLIKLVVATRTTSARAGKGRFLSVVEVEEGEKGEGGYKFDVLCLTLGVLTNMVESVESTKGALRDTLIDPKCKETRKCAQACECVDRASALYRLTDLYLDPLEDSTNDLNTSFIHGYAGILVGLVMLDTPLNQSIITSALRSTPVAFDQLVVAMEEFASLHDQSERAEEAESQRTEGEDGGGVAERIRRMLERIRE